MSSYLENIQDKNFMDLLENRDFKYDLANFFSSGRYNLSKEEVTELGFEGLAKKFSEHMRFQSANDATAIKDLNYVIDESENIRKKQSFGNLIEAWDNVESVGRGEEFTWRDSATADYAEAIIKSPSTYLGLGSFGLSKAGAKAATKSTQIMVRKKLKDYFSKNVVLKGAVTGAATEGAIGAATAGAAGEVREDLSDIGAYTEGYDYTTEDLLYDATFSAAFGAVTGGAGATITRKKAINVEELLEQQKKTNAENAKKANAASKVTIEKADPSLSNFAIDRVLDIEATLSARKGNKAFLKDKLDVDKVKEGEILKRSLLNTETEGVFTSGLDLVTMRSITAATIELAEKIKLKPNERITSKVASLIESEEVDINSTVSDLLKKYDLTREQFSLIYLADLSEAGKRLAEASQISKAVGRVSGAKIPEDSASKILNAELSEIAGVGLSTIDDIKAAEIVAGVVKNSSEKRGPAKPINYMYNTLQEVDQMRIAFMTSQPATTARNVTSTGLLAGTEILDEFYRGMYKTVFNLEGGGFGNTLYNMTSTLRGMTMDSGTAQVARQMLEKEMPDAYARIYHDTMRSEMAGSSHTNFAKAGRFVNILNTATDTVFKEAAFFSSLDRQLRTLNDKKLGTNVRDFIINNGKLDKLDQNIVDKALDDANRFTMQRTYMGDKSLFGRGARMASTINKKAPFIISGVLGIPFPRYVANHIEMIADYTPILGSITHHLSKNNTGNLLITGDAYKSVEDRMVRQVTGATLIGLGYALASTKEGEFDYKSLENAIKGDEEIASSLGFIIAPIFIGDQIYRAYHDLGLYADGNFGGWKEVGSVLGGLNDMKVDMSGVKTTVEAISKTEITEDLEELAGNFISTLTYPLPFQLAKDIQGQLDYESAGVPYTRDLAKQKSISSSEEPQKTFLMKATRFLPDYAKLLNGTKLQYTQEKGSSGYDIPYYSIFNPKPIGKMNPLKKTFTGLRSSPPKTEIEKEITRLGLKEFELYKSKRVSNPMIDYFVRANLSQNLNNTFESYRSKPIPKLAKPSQKDYDSLETVEEKREELKKFIDFEITKAIKIATDQLKSMTIKNPVMAAGYMRNVYYLKRAEISAEKFNKAAKAISNGEYETSHKFIAEAESISEELQRRQIIIKAAEEMFPKGIN